MRSAIKQGPKTRAVKLMHEERQSAAISNIIKQSIDRAFGTMASCVILKSSGYKPDTDPDASDFSSKPRPKCNPDSGSAFPPAVTRDWRL